MIHVGIGGCKEDLNEAEVGLPAIIHPQKQYLVQFCECNLVLRAATSTKISHTK